MRVLIIEDEKPAAKRLEKLLIDFNESIVILDKIDSVKKSVQWLQYNGHPDLIFMDIQLADGLSFEIFDHCQIKAPVIFTTAYDEYALKAFKVNSIDYLLKPIEDEELSNAFDKLKNLSGNKIGVNPIDQIANAMEMLTNKYKNRFIIKIGEHIKSVSVNEIDYFFSREKATFCETKEKKRFLLDYSLEQLDGMLDPKRFFRINRQYIISIDAIKDIISYSNSRLKIVFHQEADSEVIVSRDRVGEFKNWLDR